MDATPHRDAYKLIRSFSSFAADARFAKETFDPFASNFEELKDKAEPEVLQRAVDTATRWAAVDTGAIEGLYEVDRGFTYSVAASASTLDNAHLEKGNDVQDKINDAMAGYEYVLDVATERKPATELWIKELHSTICASQKTYRVLTGQGWQDHELPKGEYKTQPNNPMNVSTGNIHEYASPSDTPAEMARLVEELRSEEFRAAHSVLQAAYAHYAFVCIHPFGDGNGRVARALASTYLYRSPGIPLVIFADQKGEYLQTLEAADGGKPSLFVAFIRNCALDIIGMISQDMRRPNRPEPSESIQRLQAALLAPQGLTHTEMDALAGRIAAEWHTALNSALSEAGVERPVRIKIGRPSRNPRTLPGFRADVTNPVEINGSCEPPAVAQRQVFFAVRIPSAGTSTVDFVLFHQNDEIADIALREVHPVITTAFRYRLRVLADDYLRQFVEALTSSAQEHLRKSGYTP